MTDQDFVSILRNYDNTKGINYLILRYVGGRQFEIRVKYVGDKVADDYRCEMIPGEGLILVRFNANGKKGLSTFDLLSRVGNANMVLRDQRILDAVEDLTVKLVLSPKVEKDD